MAESNVDRLSIEVEASADPAAQKLNAVADAAERLAKSLGRGGMTNQLASLATQLERIASIGDMSRAVNGMMGIAAAARGMDGAKLSESFANQLPKISQALSQMPEGAASNLRAVGEALHAFGGATVAKPTADNVAALARALAENPIPPDAAQRLSDVASAVATLGSVKGPGNAIGNQIKKLAEGCAALSQVDLPSEKVQRLVEALSHLAEIPKNGLSTTVRAMMQLPNAAQAMHSLDFDQLAADCKRLSAALSDLPTKLKNVADGMRQLGKASAAANKFSSLASGSGSKGGLFSSLWHVNKAILSVRFMANTIRGAGQAIENFVSISGGYVEDMNLFTTAMGEFGQQAYDYAQRVNSALGIDTQEWLKGQGVFMSMAQGMGVASDNAATMSQQLTQLSYDLASFYNMDVETAMEKVQAGLSGQLRPLRELGYDLSDARIKQDALTWGITKSVDEMTQAEKSLLRYREMMEQVSYVHGDMARTVQSPMNQLRILKSVVQQAARAWSAVFLPALQAVLSILIPIARAIATVGNMIASLTGGSQMMADSLAGIGSGGTFSDIVGGVEDVEEATEGAGSAAGGAADEYEKLKRTILGFDEINALKAVSDQTGGGGSGGGSGSGGGGGMEGFELPTYDFLGNAEDAYRELTDRILAMFERIGEKWEPFVRQAQDSWARIKATFEGVDLLGPLEDNIVEINGLLAALGTQGLEVFTQLWEDLEVPKTIEVNLNFYAEAWATATAVVNTLGSAVNGLLDGLSPLTHWFGEKLRGAMEWGTTELEKWRRWLEDMEEPAGRLGEAIGKLATAIGEKLTPSVDKALEFAGSLASLLGAGLRTALEWLIEHAIPFFEGLADYISTHSIGEMAYDAFVKPFDDMREKIGLTDEKVAGWKERIEKIPAAVGAVKTAFETMHEKVGTLVEDITDLLSALGTDLKNFGHLDFDFSETKEALAQLVEDAMGGGEGGIAGGLLEGAFGAVGDALVNGLGGAVEGARDKLSAKIGGTVVGAIGDSEPTVTGASKAYGLSSVTSWGDGAESGKSYATGKFQTVGKAGMNQLNWATTPKKYGTSAVTYWGNGAYNRRSYSNSKFLSVGKGAMSQLKWVDTPKNYGKNIGTYFGNGVYGQRGYVGSQAYSVGENAVYNMYWPETAKKYGRWTADGFAVGLSYSGGATAVYNAACKLAQNVFDGIDFKMKYGSPSKVMQQYGRWSTEGYAVGMEAETGKVYAASELVAQSALDGLSSVTNAGTLDVGGTIGTTMSVNQLATGQFELDWDRMEQAVAQGTLEGVVAGGTGSSGSGRRAELVLQVNGQTLGRVALDAIDQMAANGTLDLDLVGV